MQLGFQTIPEPNAQVIETYIYRYHNLKIEGCAPGLVLRLLLNAGVSGALGRLPANLLLRGLPLRLLWLRNHLLHDLLAGDFYTYAYDMRMYAI